MGMGMGMGMGASKGLELLNKEKVKVMKREGGLMRVKALTSTLHNAECISCVYTVADKICESSCTWHSVQWRIKLVHSHPPIACVSSRIQFITHTPHLPPLTVLAPPNPLRRVEEAARGSQQRAGWR
jgi:hypothetical protein